MILLNNIKTSIKAVCGLVVALSIAGCIFFYSKAKKLSQSLEMANNNIEAYLGIINDSNTKNNTLLLTVDLFKQANDSLILKLDNVADKHDIKIKEVDTSATQTLTIYVNASKGVLGDLIEIIKDSTYNDSINYNNLTKVYYTIGKDTVDIAIDMLNTQYLYTYKHKEYKNKKNFFKRLFTLDFKKVWKYKYLIINTNDLIKTDDVRIVEITE